MAESKYFIINGAVDNDSIAYKLYEVEFLKPGKAFPEVKIIRPITGTFFALKEGSAIMVDGNNVFDTKEKALTRMLTAILKGNIWLDRTSDDLQAAYTQFFWEFFREPKRTVNRVWEFERTYKGLMKELYHG